MINSSLKILSLNVFGTPFHPKAIIKSFMRNNVRKRFRLIAEAIRQTDPDIIFLQEVVDYPHYYFLRKLLPQYPYNASKRIIYGPRGGLVILSKLPLQNAQYYDFLDKGNIRNKSITGHLSAKGVLLTKLKDTNLWLGNTHLTQNSDHDWSSTNRFVPLMQSQLEQTIVHTNAIIHRGEQIVFAGDFNMPKGSDYYDNFIKKSKLQDIFKRDSFNTYHETFLPVGEHVGRLDFIFISPQIKTSGLSYILKEPFQDNKGEKLYASDHIGLVATCKIS